MTQEKRQPAILNNANLSDYTQPVPRGFVCMPDILQTSSDDPCGRQYTGDRSPFNDEQMTATYLRVDSPPMFFVRALNTFEVYHINDFAENAGLLGNADSALMRVMELFDNPIKNAQALNDITEAYIETSKIVPEKSLKQYRRDFITAVLGTEYLGTLNQYKEKAWLRELMESNGTTGKWVQDELSEFTDVGMELISAYFRASPSGVRLLSDKIMSLTMGVRLYVRKKS